VKLIVDAQLPPALAVELRKAGCDAVAVVEIGLRHAKDSAIWNYAVEHGAAILTKDEDFAERCIHTQNSPVIVWMRIGNATNPRLLEWFLPVLPAVLQRLEAGDRLIEVR
jgi:predicted nuclease of predicted toxin-antitoxin system